jgi:Mg-chelatase subunit ChlD
VKSKEEMKKLATTSGAAEDISIVYCIDISGSMGGERISAVKETILSQI